MKSECFRAKFHVFDAVHTAGGKKLLLFSTAKDIFVRDIVGKAPNIPVNLADRTNSSSEKHKFITSSITFHWSPFVTCLAYGKPKIKFMPSCTQIEHNKQH
jgi:hypothetical protein